MNKRAFVQGLEILEQAAQHIEGAGKSIRAGYHREDTAHHLLDAAEALSRGLAVMIVAVQSSGETDK